MAGSGPDPTSTQALADQVASVKLWYHTIDLPGGSTTPGWFDLRPVVNDLPWPDVAGKRCLDVGTYDGFLAFELERRGASEVVATDILDHDDWDWTPRQRAAGPETLAHLAGEKGRGFEIARDALGSSVRREIVSIYDLSPEQLGTFDVVVCGSLLLHLRDPFRALEAVRSVCDGEFLSIEEIDVRMTLRAPRRPAFALRGDRGQWLVPNAAAHRRMLDVAGFGIDATTRPGVIPTGEGHRDHGASLRQRGRGALFDLLVGGHGIPFRAVRCHPEV